MTEQEFYDQYGKYLNEEQIRAVKTVDGPVLLLAVPGSGKTTTLVSRLGYMIYVLGIAPENILTLTYTVSATKDMADRFAAMFGVDISGSPQFRTINGICARIITAYGRSIGKTAFELVTEEKQTAKMLSDIYVKHMGEYPTESDIKTVRTLITYSKNMLLSDAEIEKEGRNNNIELLPVFKEYNKTLRELSLMDYDDQMVYAYKMLKSSSELLEYYRNIYRYICVDEAQDTSRIQHLIIGLLSGKSGNLFMVGDEDQSIYGFRAAYPEALLNFEKDHPGAKVLVMDKNYRSNARIVEASDRFIQHNKDRHQKHMPAIKDPGDDINIISLSGRAGQYSYLLKVAENVDHQIAVLYRDNESVLPLVDLLERNNMLYRIKSIDMSFFSHRIVTDIVNIIRFSFDQTDEEIFMKIYFKCQTYLRKPQAEQLCRMADGSDILEAADDMYSLSGNVRGRCKALHTHLVNMRNETPLKALNRIERYMGYGEYLDRSGMDTGKLFILKRIAYNENTLDGFIRRLEYLQDTLKNKKTDYKSGFILSTIHSSKGLEYDEVYLMDVCDGVFPGNVPVINSRMSVEEKKAFEEERRLFYVGMTRAKRKLNIFRFDAEPSTFINEMSKPVEKKVRIAVKKKPKIKNTAENNHSCMDYPSELIIGQKVMQPKYGSGVITDVSVDDDEIPTKFSVLFANGDEKTFMYPFAFTMGMKLT